MVAIGIRLVAVLFSRGFLHSDDHYDTIAPAWDWIANGMTGENGYLRWKGSSSSLTVNRFPLYVLTLWALIKSFMILGLTSLEAIMYGIRAVHAAVSLIPVWAGFSITRLVTRSDRWAVATGLIVALHFAMPFLGVRNLIEVVGGSIWMLALYHLYRWEQKRQVRSLYLAGICAGLAWMIRFQIALAVLPVPVVLWWRDGNPRAAIHFSMAVGIMILASAFADWAILGRFAGSTINIVMNTGLGGSMYQTIPLMYTVVLLGLLIPPVSFVALWLWARRSFRSTHLLLLASFLSFFIFHALHDNQQERFLLPMLPQILLMTVLALYHKIRDDGYLFRHMSLTRATLVWVLGVNLIVLIFLTPAYGHKGLIEPLVALGQMDPEPRVLIVQPNVRHWPPREYADAGVKTVVVRRWDALHTDEVRRQDYDYIIVYPVPPSALKAHVDSIESVLGPTTPAWRIEPSAYDWLLARLNPRHNRSYEGWVLRPATAAERGR
jgi:hypothetical protein